MAKITQKIYDSQPDSAGVDLWSNQGGEGKLSVDVMDAGEEIVVLAPMAGARQDAIEVFVHNDIITIRGQRALPVPASQVKEVIHTECYWGAFSRTVVLPAEVKAEQSRAEYKNGVLTVRIPKRVTSAKIPVKIIEE